MIVKPLPEKRNRARGFPSRVANAETLPHRSVFHTLTRTNRITPFLKGSPSNFVNTCEATVPRNPSIPPLHLSLYLNSSGPQYSTQGPLFVSSHPSLFLSFLYLSLSPLLGSPQLRGPGAFRPDTHTRTQTHTYTYIWTHTHTHTPLHPPTDAAGNA